MTDFDPRNWTWTCMVCGRERPDAAISVAYRPIAGLEAHFPAMRHNVRYCNDKLACITKANEKEAWHGMPRS